MEVVRISLLFAVCALTMKNVVCADYGSCSSSISCWEAMLDRVKEAEYAVRALERKIDRQSGAEKEPIVAFSAYGPEDKQISKWETIKYSSVLLNSGNGYDPDTGKFIAPVSGLYQFSASLCNVKGQYFVYEIVKGSDAIAVMTQWDDTESCNSVQAVSLVSKGDVVFVRGAFVQGGYNLYENVHRRNTFTGVLLRSTSETSTTFQ